MTMTRGQSVLLATVIPLAAVALVAAPQSDGRSRLADLVSQLTRESKWTLTAKVGVSSETIQGRSFRRVLVGFGAAHLPVAIGDNHPG